MRFPLSTGMAKNGNFIPVIERNRALIPGPKGNDGNKGGEYFPQSIWNFSQIFLENQAFKHLPHLTLPLGYFHD